MMDSTIKNSLVVGKRYKIRATKYDCGPTPNESGRNQTIERMECVGIHEHLATFRRATGYTESFTYWDLMERLIF